MKAKWLCNYSLRLEINVSHTRTQRVNSRTPETTRKADSTLGNGGPRLQSWNEGEMAHEKHHFIADLWTAGLKF